MKILSRRKTLLGLSGTIAGGAIAVNLLSLPNSTTYGPNQIKLANRIYMPANGITALAWSPTGNRIATIGDFGQRINIWNSNNNSIVVISGYKNGDGYLGHSVGFLSDQDLLTPSFDIPDNYSGLAMTMWNATTGKVSQDIAGPFPGQFRSRNWAENFKISFDKKNVILAPSGFYEPVNLYDTQSWKIQDQIAWRSRILKTDNIISVDISPNKNLVAIGLLSGLVQILDLTNGKTIEEFSLVPEMLASVFSVAFDPNNRYLAGGVNHPLGFNQKQNATPVHFINGKTYSPLSIWSVTDWSLLFRYYDCQAPIRQISWNSNGKYIGFVDQNGAQILEIDEKGVRPIWKYLHRNVMTLQFAPGKNKFAIGGNQIVEIFEIYSH